MGGFKKQHTARSEPSNPTNLGDLKKENLQIFCWCNRCGHNADIDVDPLISALGSLFPVPEIGGRMRCSSCQARDITTRPAWPSYGGGQIARHN
ncbi:hypothetical protein N9368_04935 [Alphaproteobacteria bacterium]|jgi:hypothetical protein|nr:hypothetical protein [Alphaproteobacteria bacterium]